MKIGAIITGMIVMIAISTMPVMAASITIIDGQDEVKYKFNGFLANDPWTVKLYQGSTLKYDFSGTISQIGPGNPYYVWLSSRGNTGNGARLCVVAGTYDADATGTHNTETIIKKGAITISENDVCSPTISPIPELSPLILTSAGILGLVLISRRYTK